MPLPNPARQQAARETLADLFRYPRGVYAIHYACQSFHSDVGAAPSQRIITLAVRHLASGQIEAFSVPRVIETLHRGGDDRDLTGHDVERALLGQFAEFLRQNRNARFVHWNMRDDRFGFPAIAHRSRVLLVEMPEVAERDRFDLAQLLVDVYGDNYVLERAKLEALAARNGLPMGSFLTGAEEAAAVAAGRWMDVHASTLTKVRLIGDIAMRAHDRTLVTAAGFVARHGGPARLMLQKLIENPGYSVATIAAGIAVVLLKTSGWLFS